MIHIQQMAELGFEADFLSHYIIYSLQDQRALGCSHAWSIEAVSWGAK